MTLDRIDPTTSAGGTKPTPYPGLRWISHVLLSRRSKTNGQGLPQQPFAPVRRGQPGDLCRITCFYCALLHQGIHSGLDLGKRSSLGPHSGTNPVVVPVHGTRSLGAAFHHHGDQINSVRAQSERHNCAGKCVSIGIQRSMPSTRKACAGNVTPCVPQDESGIRTQQKCHEGNCRKEPPPFRATNHRALGEGCHTRRSRCACTAPALRWRCDSRPSGLSCSSPQAVGASR